MDKEELRAAIRTAKKEGDKELMKAWSKACCDNILADKDVLAAKVVMAFHPLPDEIDILPVLSALSGMGKTVLLPEVIGPREMWAREYDDGKNMSKGYFNIFIPKGRVFLEVDKIDVVICPGIAFDREGHRLGRGKGFYDSFLKDVQNAVKIGIGYPFQLVEHVPVEPYDILMDKLII
ncbi:MAG: 5-formyltetrahydrofolate cyclo-ligase [Bacteroidales bacterium]|nr:5-formyltetrahydrofolate cyclo-ligase [Bacteroidales bacterium]